MIELIASASLGGIVGFFTCAMMTMSKVAEVRADEYESAVHWQSMWKHALDTSIDNAAAHTRATDRGNTLQARIDRALEQVTDNANATVKRIERILRGEQGA